MEEIVLHKKIHKKEDENMKKKYVGVCFVIMIVIAGMIGLAFWSSHKKAGIPDANSVTADEYFSKAESAEKHSDREIKIKYKIRQQFSDEIIDDFIISSEARADYYCISSQQKFFKVQILEEQELQSFLGEDPGECVVETQTIGGKAYVTAKMTKGY